jgi:hypothetical protein
MNFRLLGEKKTAYPFPDFDRTIQAFSKLIVTCSTFALYTFSFTKDANKALVAAETPEGDAGAKKRSDFLVRFETNFNHWLRVRLIYCPCAPVALNTSFFRSMSTVYSSTHPARMCPYSLSLFALIA